MKRGLILLFCIVLLASLVLAQKIEISTIKESFLPGENITLKVSLLNEENNPINDNVLVSIEDAGKINIIQKTIPSNILVDVDLGEKASYGYWKITAKYNDIETNKLFMVEINELAQFSLDGDVVTITNIGNTRYTKDIQIAIGDIVKIKSLDLGIGERTSFRSITPDGIYNIQITDGKTTLSRSDAGLTGQAVGVKDENVEEGRTGGITGVLNPKEGEEVNRKTNVFVYVFLVIIVGAAILLAIERIYRKRIAS